MAEAEFSVSFAGPLVTVQDAGRRGYMRYGVSASGPMDRLAFNAAHAALGNEPGQTAIEISLGGLILRCDEGSVTVAITGGDFIVEHEGQKSSSWTILTINKGEKLTIRAGNAGSWAYLVFAGVLQANDWLGSHATLSTSGLGGGALKPGDRLTIADTSVRNEREGDIARPEFLQTDPFRVVMGPQDRNFVAEAAALFQSTTFTATDAYDRMGMRLSGPVLELNKALSIPSEPIVRGSVQVSGDGIPTVLLADHQTTGGYPKIATVISGDIDQLTQLRAGQTLKFAAISPEEAIITARSQNVARNKYLAEIAVPRGTLLQRLMRENLNHGFLPD
ncbi:MAG: biotin-dependent carboxyltransferase family protein [Pikeienuella sp.]